MGVLTGKGQGALTVVGAGPKPNIFLMKSIMVISFGVFTSFLGSFARIHYQNIFCVAMQHIYMYNNIKD